MKSITKSVSLGRRKHYTETRKPYEYGMYSAEDDHTGLSLVLVSVEYQIESYIGEEEISHITILK